MGSLAAKADRFASIAVERVTINIKREKAKTYLFRASLELSGKGRISTSAEGYSIEQGIREISNKLYEIIKSAKERKKNVSGKIRYGLDEE
jgi:ribosome-associated translation inhibitor RaiA